jgi:zinc transporter, ZIP family
MLAALGWGAPAASSLVVGALATPAGWAIAGSASGDLQATIDGSAAGALLVMLIDSMIPEAARRADDVAGLVTVLGFAVAAALSIAG